MSKMQKFNFISSHLLNKPKEEEKIFVSFNPKTRFVIFSQRNNSQVSGFAGKYIQLFADLEKKTLAWVFAPSEYVSPEQLKNYTQIKSYGKGTICIYIPQGIINALRMTVPLKRVEVLRYKPAEYLDNNTYNYINLK